MGTSRKTKFQQNMGAPFPWPRAASQINLIRLFPDEKHRLVEPFGGSGQVSIVCAREELFTSVLWNDLHPGLYVFLKLIRDLPCPPIGSQSKALHQRAVELSRKKTALEIWNSYASLLERLATVTRQSCTLSQEGRLEYLSDPAATTYVVACTFKGPMDFGPASGQNQKSKVRCLPDLEQWSSHFDEGIGNLDLSNENALSVIRAHDAEDCFHYLDPAWRHRSHTGRACRLDECRWRDGSLRRRATPGQLGKFGGV